MSFKYFITGVLYQKFTRVETFFAMWSWFLLEWKPLKDCTFHGGHTKCFHGLKNKTKTNTVHQLEWAAGVGSWSGHQNAPTYNSLQQAWRHYPRYYFLISATLWLDKCGYIKIIPAIIGMFSGGQKAFVWAQRFLSIVDCPSYIYSNPSTVTIPVHTTLYAPSLFFSVP